MSINFKLSTKETKKTSSKQALRKITIFAKSKFKPKKVANTTKKDPQQTQINIPLHPFRKTVSKKNPHQTNNTPMNIILRWLIISLPSILFLIIIPILIFASTQTLTEFFHLTNFTITSKSLYALLSNKEASLAKTKENVTNVLVVGIDSRSDDQNNLQNTDSILLISYQHNNQQITIISFPRDLLVRYPNTYNYGKINSVYLVGEMQKKGSGLDYLKQVIQSISGQEVNYHVMINFQSFAQIIDVLGGININVERAFTDYYYPTNNKGIQTISFNKGSQKMDGATALKYARSRHALGAEGSDFARTRRQQRLVTAITEKFKISTELQNPLKIYTLLQTLSQNIESSPITPEDIQAGLSLLINNYTNVKTINLVLDPAVANKTLIQVGSNSAFGYHILPIKGLDRWQDIQTFLNKKIMQNVDSK